MYQSALQITICQTMGMSAEWWRETLHIRKHFHLEVLVNGIVDTFCCFNFDQQTHFRLNQQFVSFSTFCLNPSRKDSRKVLPSAPGWGRRGQRWSEVKVQDVSHRTGQGVGHTHLWRSQRSTKTWRKGKEEKQESRTKKGGVGRQEEGGSNRGGCCNFFC